MILSEMKLHPKKDHEAAKLVGYSEIERILFGRNESVLLFCKYPCRRNARLELFSQHEGDAQWLDLTLRELDKE